MSESVKRERAVGAARGVWLVDGWASFTAWAWPCVVSVSAFRLRPGAEGGGVEVVWLCVGCPLVGCGCGLWSVVWHAWSCGWLVLWLLVGVGVGEADRPSLSPTVAGPEKMGSGLQCVEMAGRVLVGRTSIYRVW